MYPLISHRYVHPLILTRLLMPSWLYSRDGLITVAVALYFMAVGTDIMLTIADYKTSQKSVASMTETTGGEIGIGGEGGGGGGGGGIEGKGGSGEGNGGGGISGVGRGRRGAKQPTKEPLAQGLLLEVTSSASPKRKQKQKPGTLR